MIEKASMTVPKIIILGGGFAGLAVAKHLSNTLQNVWLIDKTNHHLFQPLLYEVAAATLSPADIALPIREIIAHAKNITVQMGEVVSIDKENRLVQLRNNERLTFDYLVIALGAQTSYYGHDEWRPFASGLKSLTDALKIREQILISFEKAERSANRSDAAPYLNFVIIGGGPKGVEMAGTIAEMAHHTMLCNFRHIDPAAAKIYLIEKLPRILNAFPETLAIKAQSYLEKLNVKVLTNAPITQMTKEGVQVDETWILSQNIYWLAGDEASPVLQTLQVPLDRQGRVIVNADLSIPNHPEIFVIGDAASVQDANGHPIPAVAPAALQQGHYIGKRLKNLNRQNSCQPIKPFSFLDKGMLAAIGKAKGIGTFKRFQYSGFIAWFIWVAIHIIYLSGVRNRIIVMLKWFVSFFTGKRSARLIYRSIDEK